MTLTAIIQDAAQKRLSAPDLARDERDQRITDAVERERARREAARVLDAEERGPSAPPCFQTLRERLAQPLAHTSYRIDGWQPLGTRVMVAAQFKAGKTSLVGNTIRPLVDGGLFLGRDKVTPITGTVALLDFEMGANQLFSWYRDQHIQNDDRVIVVPMRGQVSAFDILDSRVRRDWARRLRDARCEYLILDCLRPLMDALGLNEHTEAGRLLVAADALLTEAGIPEAQIVHHMGHTGERSRGDSRLRDWPDVEWRLVREDEDPASKRFLSAYGRDVDVPECQLDFDLQTRRLTVAGGSRRDAKTTIALDDVLAVLRTAPEPMSGRAIKHALTDTEHPRQAVDDALKAGARSGAITAHPGPRRSTLYVLPDVSVPVSRSVPSVSQNSSVQCPSAIKHGTLEHSGNHQSVSQDTRAGNDERF